MRESRKKKRRAYYLLLVTLLLLLLLLCYYHRHSKPFNPLLGETYELVRKDLGYCLIAEQVHTHDITRY